MGRPLGCRFSKSIHVRLDDRSYNLIKELDTIYGISEFVREAVREKVRKEMNFRDAVILAAGKKDALLKELLEHVENSEGGV